MCTAQTKKTLFAARSSSGRRISVTSSVSCPNSPRRSRLSCSGGGGGVEASSLGEPSSSSAMVMAAASECLKGLTEDEVVEVGANLSSSLGNTNSSGSRPPGIHRSASTTNAIRPRTAPAGLYSYTGMCKRVKMLFSFRMRFYFISGMKIIGLIVLPLWSFIDCGCLMNYSPGSAPPSVHGSLVNINASSQGSAIYVGYTPTARGSVSASSFSLGNNRQRSGSQISVTSPAPSPQSSPRRVRSKKLAQ